MKFSTSGSSLVLAAPLLLAALVSCTVISGAGTTTGTTSGEASTGTGSGGGAGAGGGAPAGATGKDVFLALQADILGECGACHKLGGVADAPFLALPDVYSSIAAWPGIITLTPTSSILLTHPGLSSHGAGMAPDMSKPLRAKVLAWLQKEATEIPKPTESTKPYITPFKPLLGAFNTVYLDPLGKTLESSSISFNAVELGSPPSMLLLTHIEVHPVADTTIHLVHPIFSVYPDGGGEEPDPIDSFSSVDASIDLNGDGTLGTGTLILTNWQKGGRIGLAFETAEVSGLGTPLDGCKSDTTKAQFVKEVIPQLQYCAATCHSGMKDKPTAAMNLSQLMMMPVDAACAQVRARIHPGDPDTSDILIVTDPSKQVAHGYKFAGNKSKYSAFKAAVSPWINAEK
jgi:hypothetical protein